MAKKKADQSAAKAKAEAEATAVDKLQAAIVKAMKRSDAVRTLGGPAEPIEAISTGSAALDEASGIGGWAVGRIIEIFGQESSGKTTLTLEAIAAAQERGFAALFIDAEHALDPSYAQKVGVDTDKLLLSQPDSGEEALNILEAAIRSGVPTIAVVDSVAALVPQAELDGEVGDPTMGAQARMMGQALRKLKGAVRQSKCVVIFINQIRAKIGVTYGAKTTTTGGNALKFYASQRVSIYTKDKIKQGETVIGSRVVAEFKKNKLAPPFRTAEFVIKFGHGIDEHTEMLDLALELGVIVKEGTTFYTCDEMGKQKLAVGRPATVALLRDNAEIAKPIEHAVKTGELPTPSAQDPNFYPGVSYDSP